MNNYSLESNNYALELLQDHFEATCKQLNEIHGDKEITWEVIDELKARKWDLQAAIMKLSGITYDDILKGTTYKDIRK
jgi:hypothetical protein